MWLLLYTGFVSARIRIIKNYVPVSSSNAPVYNKWEELGSNMTHTLNAALHHRQISEKRRTWAEHLALSSVLLMLLSEYTTPAVTKMGEAEPPAACHDSKSCGNELELLSQTRDGSSGKYTPLRKWPVVVQHAHKWQNSGRDQVAFFAKVVWLNSSGHRKEHRSKT